MTTRWNRKKKPLPVAPDTEKGKVAEDHLDEIAEITDGEAKVTEGRVGFKFPVVMVTKRLKRICFAGGAYRGDYRDRKGSNVSVWKN